MIMMMCEMMRKIMVSKVGEDLSLQRLILSNILLKKKAKKNQTKLKSKSRRKVFILVSITALRERAKKRGPKGT
jgi:hypothetical protein